MLPSHPRYAQALYYFLLTRPNPLVGVVDFYVFGNVFNKMNNWKSDDFVVREKLGGGNFGMAYEGLQLKVCVCSVTAWETSVQGLRGEGE